MRVNAHGTDGQLDIGRHHIKICCLGINIYLVCSITIIDWPMVIYTVSVYNQWFKVTMTNRNTLYLVKTKL